LQTLPRRSRVRDDTQVIGLVSGWSLPLNAHRGDQLLNYLEGMNDRLQRVAGIFMALLLMLAGLSLCLDGLKHGGLTAFSGLDGL
jgi:hypothetical protein